MEPFELEWMGGAAEHHFRKARPGIDDLPWGTLDVSAYPPEVADAARATWTDSAYTEYKAVAAFSEVLSAMCEAKAPLDLLGMASSFVADEVVHVELASRMAMELGGAVARQVNFEALYPAPPSSLSAFERCNDLVLRVSCVAEAFSGKMAVSALRSTTHPLTRAVLERIVADESLHYRLGGLYFATLKAVVPSLGPKKDSRSARYRATLGQIQDIGWVETRLFKEQVREAVRHTIVDPLSAVGIMVPPDEVEKLLA